MLELERPAMSARHRWCPLSDRFPPGVIAAASEACTLKNGRRSKTHSAIFGCLEQEETRLAATDKKRLLQEATLILQTLAPKFFEIRDVAAQLWGNCCEVIGPDETFRFLGTAPFKTSVLRPTCSPCLLAHRFFGEWFRLVHWSKVLDALRLTLSRSFYRVRAFARDHRQSSIRFGLS